MYGLAQTQMIKTVDLNFPPLEMLFTKPATADLCCCHRKKRSQKFYGTCLCFEIRRKQKKRKNRIIVID